jgi:uroporphyrinogen-III synthase
VDKKKTQLGFIHCFIPPKNKASEVRIEEVKEKQKEKRLQLLLHNTGENQQDLYCTRFS